MLVALEITFRLGVTEPAIPPLIPDPILNHVWAPNEAFTHEEWVKVGIPPYVHHYNAQSWISDRNFEGPPAPGIFRIAYLGDSFTEGTCPVADSLPSIIGRELTVTGYNSVEVINTGTSSYAPTLYFLLFKTRLLALKPHLVVVNVDMTDVFDDSLYRATLEVDDMNEPVACPPGHPDLGKYRRTERGLERLNWLQRGVQYGLGHSAFLRALQRRIQQSGEHRRVAGDTNVPPLFAWCSEDRTEQVATDIDLSLDMLRRLIMLARAHGIKVIITGVPHYEQLSGLWSLRPMQDLSIMSREEGVPFLDPSEGIKKHLGAQSLDSIYIPGDMHFNTRGYRIWADVQLEFLRAYLKK